MSNIKGWMACLKPFEPKILSLGDSDPMIRNIASISENTVFRKGTLYIGALKSAAYRFRSMDGITLFLINDSQYYLERFNCGNNTVVVLLAQTDSAQIFELCSEYLRVQEEVVEQKQKLLDFYLSDHSLQGILDYVSKIIENPLMIIDNSYRVIGATDQSGCDDLLWLESIRDGYCSFEFVSQFNQLSEIDAINKGTSPVLAGCLMSPMRRCIVKLFVDKQPVGYLLAVESSKPFDRGTVELLEVASKLLSKELAYTALEMGVDLYHSSWDAIVNAIEEVPKSDSSLAEYLQGLGLRMHSQYYVLLFSLAQYDMKEDKQVPLYQLFHTLFPFCAASVYKQDAVLIVDYQQGQPELVQTLLEKQTDFTKMDFKIAVSDMFGDFSDFKRHYDQAKQAQSLMNTLKNDAVVCTYEEVRVYDMLLEKLEPSRLPLFMRRKEHELYEYDRENGTEYFRTLYSYIKNSRRLQDTSDELHIHKNTVSYRINRLKELFDIDLNDAETRIGFYLAYHVLILHGWDGERT